MLEGEHEQRRKEMNRMQMEYNKQLAAQKRDRDLKKKYDENMARISAPGAYFPHANSITLNTSSFTGKSNRVVLHEIVHAATMAIINQYRRNPGLLTARQIEAVESVIDMYEYAKASDRIPTNEYGLTNLEGFIAEAFTRFGNEDCHLRR